MQLENQAGPSALSKLSRLPEADFIITTTAVDLNTIFNLRSQLENIQPNVNRTVCNLAVLATSWDSTLWGKSTRNLETSVLIAQSAPRSRKHAANVLLWIVDLGKDLPHTPPPLPASSPPALWHGIWTS